MKKLILILLLSSFSLSTFARSLNCSIYTGKFCDNDPNHPNGTSINVGYMAGFSKVRVLCEDGYVIDADELAGFVMGPGVHRLDLRLSCPGSSNDLTGRYSGIKFDLGIGLDLSLAIIANDDNLCTLRGYGFGLGMNIVAGAFKVRRDESRIEEYELCSKKQKLIKKWTFKKCTEIKMEELEIPYPDKPLTRGPTTLFEEFCPTSLDYYPAYLKDEDIRKLVFPSVNN